MAEGFCAGFRLIFLLYSWGISGRVWVRVLGYVTVLLLNSRIPSFCICFFFGKFVYGAPRGFWILGRGS